MRDIEGIDLVIKKLAPHWSEIDVHFENENNRFKKLIAQNHDSIGRVLKCHLVIENYLGNFLSQHFQISDIEKAKLSFYQKAILLPSSASAAAWVKPGIICLNKIRNQFGHSLRAALEWNEISEIMGVLKIARNGVSISDPIAAIEAFTTIACVALVIPPPHLQKVFMEAFSEIRLNVNTEG